MTLDINELERLRAEAVEHAAQMTAAPSYWRHTPAGQFALNAVVEHFPEIVARLKAAEEMREALAKAASVIMALAEQQAMPDAAYLPTLGNIRDALAAYDKAKG